MNLKTKKVIFLSLIFISFYYFFSQSCPLIISDHDDWRLLSYSRSFLDFIGEANPTKIFTETIISINADIACMLIMPFTNDYVLSIAIISAITLSIFITIYIYMFFQLLLKNYKLDINTSIAYTIIFILFHFLIFRHKPSNNYFLFYSWDITCYYNYTIPNILSASLVLFWLRIKSIHQIIVQKDFIKLGLIYVVILITLCSNLYSSIIFISLICTKLLFLLFQIKKSFFTLSNLKKNGSEFVIIIIWITTHIIELLLGGRAAMIAQEQLSSNSSFIDELIKSTAYTYYNYFNMNNLFIIVVGISIILFVLLQKHQKKELLYIVSAGIINISYLILLSTKVYPSYMTRPDVIFGPCFFLFLFICFTLLYSIKRLTSIYTLLPVLILVIFLECRTKEKTFINTIQGHTPHYWEQLDNFIINQIKQADSLGLSEVNVEVPDFKNDINWPLTEPTGEHISRTLYKHQLIQYPIKVNINVNPNLKP